MSCQVGLLAMLYGLALYFISMLGTDPYRTDPRWRKIVRGAGIAAVFIGTMIFATNLILDPFP